MYHLLHELKFHAVMDGWEADALHHREYALQNGSRNHAAALGDHEAQESVNVDSFAMHDVGAGQHLNDFAEGVAVVHAADKKMVPIGSKVRAIICSSCNSSRHV